MKERVLKRGVPLFLVAIMVAAGVLASSPITSQAAAKGTTYNVVFQDGSVSLSLVSINSGAVAPNTSHNEGQGWQMVIGTKVLTEKVKSIGGTATYYEVTIPKKSYKSPTSEFSMPGGGVTIRSSIMKADAKGKLYISGGDVDVASVQDAKKMTSKIGDGKVDPAGSMSINWASTSIMTLKETGKKYGETTSTVYLTTGQSTCIVKGSKSRLEGKVIPNDDTTKTLSQPLVGKPIDLNAGTGTLVGSNGLFNTKNPQMGMLDHLTGIVNVLKITK
jgi:hypothetical protein